MSSQAQARDVLLVMLGGGLGSIARYGVGKVMGPMADSHVPWHTFLVNVSGAFVLGALVAIAARQGWPGWWRPLLGVGVLGGYTTFSTFSLEATELVLRGMHLTAGLYAFGSVALGLFAAWLGLLFGRVVGG
jgi:fluoride exporter